jgi:hypothetical protein
MLTLYIFSQRVSSFYFRPLLWSGVCVSILFLLPFPFFYFVPSVCTSFFFLFSLVFSLLFCLYLYFDKFIYLALLFSLPLSVSLLLILATFIALSRNLTFYRR